MATYWYAGELQVVLKGDRALPLKASHADSTSPVLLHSVDGS